MVFSSSAFIFAFLPVTLTLYFLPLSKKNKRLDISKKNLVLLVTSLVFYAWGEPIYLFLMLISIFFNFNIGKDIYINKENNKSLIAKALFITAIIFNLFILGYFKYAGFLADNINYFFGTNLTNPELPLPVGISFYTFQALSYIADIYSGKCKVQNKFIPFACYITMFPQLIAGPIVQYSDIEKQLSNRKVDLKLFCDGIIFFIRGLGKKIIFANTVGAIYDDIFTQELGEHTVTSLWIGIICYTLQIYFDFSGYSDMAVGLGKMLGFEFVKNFNFPYKAKSVTDFWRRWHISLSSWFRDYVYIPLGGNRKGTARTIINILTVWLLTGIWHGASRNFLIWGGYYGILLICEKYIFKKVINKLPRLLSWGITLVFVVIGWVFFSIENLSIAFDYLKIMFGFTGATVFSSEDLYLLNSYGFSLAIMILSSLGFFEYISVFKKSETKLIFKSLFYIGVFILSIAFLISETYNPFLYFRF